MKIRHLVSALALAAVPAFAIVRPAVAGAQADPRAGDPRTKLAARLDSGAVAAILPVIDAAAEQGLPIDPLVQKALEGASKRAPSDRIVTAVRRLSSQLATAKLAFGGAGSASELVAGASALQAGVRPEMLASLRAQRPEASLAVPLGVLTELIARGVPADTGAMAVTALLDAKVSDTQLVALRQDVERDIGVGAPPTTALIARSTGLGGGTFTETFGSPRSGTNNLGMPASGDASRTSTPATRRRP
jgi:hypothetical protein